MSVTVKNVAWHPIWLTGDHLLTPGEQREIPNVDAPNEQAWLQSGGLKIVQ